MSIIAAAIIAASVPSTTNLAERVAIMWEAHTNRVAAVEARKAKAANGKKSGVERVKSNLKTHKRRSVIGNGSGGVK